MAETKKTQTKKTEEKKPTTKTTKAVVSKWLNKTELFEKYQKMVQFVQNTINWMETDLKRIKLILNQLLKFDHENTNSLEEIDNKIQETIWNIELKKYEEEDLEIVEWKFDWYFMIGADQKKYPVPLNYSSKTKLIPWDILKLKIMPDWKFVYKLIRPAERKHLKATLSKTDDNKFTAVTEDGKVYFLNQAAVTFFKGKPWDELYILTNDKEDWWFAAIEAIIKK